MTDYQISTMTGRCSITDRAFAEGEEFYSAIFESPEGFIRRDYAVDAWTGPPEDAFCTWKSRVPAHEAPKPVWVDSAALTSFFMRLDGEEDPTRQAFRFVLGLILMRKRILKYEETTKSDVGEIWKMTLTSDKSQHDVINPGLDEERIEQVTSELNAILHSDVRDRWSEADADAAPADGESAATDAEPAEGAD